MKGSLHAQGKNRKFLFHSANILVMSGCIIDSEWNIYNCIKIKRLGHVLYAGALLSWEEYHID